MFLALLACLATAGCAEGDEGADFDVQAYNDSSEAVQVRFRATFDDDGRVVLDVTERVPPGYSLLGHLQGPRGDYHLEAWAFGSHDEMGPGMGLSHVTTCTVYVRNPDPVSINCVVP